MPAAPPRWKQVRPPVSGSPGRTPGSRIIIELFVDEAAAAEHDASPAVESLLARFADVLATDPDVRIYTRTPYATTTQEETT